MQYNLVRIKEIEAKMDRTFAGHPRKVRYSFKQGTDINQLVFASLGYLLARWMTPFEDQQCSFTEMYGRISYEYQHVFTEVDDILHCVVNDGINYNTGSSHQIEVDLKRLLTASHSGSHGGSHYVA